VTNTADLLAELNERFAQWWAGEGEAEHAPEDAARDFEWFRATWKNVVNAWAAAELEPADAAQASSTLMTAGALSSSQACAP
jgi:hypothetical protein